jgi:hypothetical protein
MQHTVNDRKDLEQSWLIQRLNAPRDHGAFKDNPFSFGGGYKNGGLTEEAMSLIRSIWSFDYMGSAEFEWGSVPATLHKIAERASKGEMQAGTFTIPLAEVKPKWGDKRIPAADEVGIIYVLAPAKWYEEIAERIREIARKGYEFSLKGDSRLNNALRPVDEWDDTKGWLELDNGFAFFVDEEMWRKTCTLFGVEVAE